MPEYAYDVDGAQLDKAKAQKLSKRNKSPLLAFAARNAIWRQKINVELAAGKSHAAGVDTSAMQKMPDKSVLCTVFCRLLSLALDVADQRLAILARFLGWA